MREIQECEEIQATKVLIPCDFGQATSHRLWLRSQNPHQVPPQAEETLPGVSHITGACETRDHTEQSGVSG